jgi:hypothetical protein
MSMEGTRASRDLVANFLAVRFCLFTLTPASLGSFVRVGSSLSFYISRVDKIRLMTF